jgi:molybdate transport system substrate-binding protein
LSRSRRLARIVTIMAGWLGAALAGHAQDIHVYAAGSLRAPMTAIAQAFTARTGTAAHTTFGASGLLRERITAGERADVFASADTGHPRALVASGWAAATRTFARNRMCVLAGPRAQVDSERVLDVMLDPAISLGTSTPGADPSGDYAWLVFRRADAVRPGAFDILERKARTLTGGPSSPPPPPDRSVYAAAVADGVVDTFLTYCTNAELAVREEPRLRVVQLPSSLEVAAEYGLAVRDGAAPGARAFADYVLGIDGQRILGQFGFGPP